MRCLFLPLFVLLSSCSSVLYYPTRGLHYDPARFGLKPEEINFSSADGTKLFGWLFHAGEKKSKGVMIQYHGNGENLSSHYITLSWVLKQGYDLFIFDYRGYGRSEGDPNTEGTVKDGEAALRFLFSRYPHTPIIVYGQSLGGAVALRNVIDLQKEIPVSAVVIDSSFPYYKQVARKILARSAWTWLFQWVPYLLLSDHYAPGGDMEKISPIPLLVLHAEGDRTVPFSCGEELFSLAKEPKEFWKIPGEGHADSMFMHGDIYQKKLLEWLGRKLGAHAN